MGGRKRRELAPDLARARDRFQVWRQKREPKTRIPESLWTLAVKLVATHGLNRTASTLGLDYYALKKRVDSEGDHAPKGPAFIELSPTISTSRECIIEFEDGMGVSMRVHLKGYDAADVVAVGRSFRVGP